MLVFQMKYLAMFHFYVRDYFYHSLHIGCSDTQVLTLHVFSFSELNTNSGEGCCVASSEICSSMLTALLISFWFIIWCECPLNVEALTVSEAVRMEFVELAKVLSCMFVVFLS